MVDFIRALARLMPDKLIAAMLNRAGKLTGRGNGWTQSRVCSLRNRHGSQVYQEGERHDRGEVTVDEAAETLAISSSSVRRLIKDGHLPAEQFCKGAPWIIKKDDLGSESVMKAADNRRRQRPSSGIAGQETMKL